jgi:hypothetical protein
MARAGEYVSHPQPKTLYFMNCHHCGHPIDTRERVGFRDYCPSCDRALHVCLNCTFHYPGYSNECRETQAARVVDKARFNFCDYFRPATVGAPTSTSPKGNAPAPAVNPRAQLDALFRKKS